jgi:regulator of sigma E protease
MIVSILLFLLVFSVVAFVHELGHFLAARYFNVAVDEFSIGLPPHIWKKRSKEMILSIGVIPIGGYVRLRGESGDKKKDEHSLEHQPPFNKMVISLAGIFMNLVLAFAIFLVGFLFSMPPLASSIKSLPTASAKLGPVVIESIRQGSPAEKAGLKLGDDILKINNQAITDPNVVSSITAQNVGKTLTLDIERAGQALTIKVKPELFEGKGSLGIAIDSQVLSVHYAWWATPYLALLETSRITAAVGQGFVNLFANLLEHGKVSAELTGPVGIARLTAEAAALGLVHFLQFIALLTINLALLNFIPLPALDGGRFIFALFEGITRRRVKPEVENMVHFAGFVLLMLLVVFVTYRDIIHLVHPSS